MHSIRFRLIALFVLVVTLGLAVSGAYSLHKLERELEVRHVQMREGVLARLRISLPLALWDVDKSNLDAILNAELMQPEVLAIRVYDTSVALFDGKMRGPAGRIEPAQPNAAIGGEPVEQPLQYQGAERAKPVPVGRAVINFSRAGIEAALRAELTWKLLEIIVLDLLLLAALTLSLRMVFDPLRQLRDGLFDLASHDTEDVEELPEHRRDEFGDVVRGFNQIQRKLKSTIERIRQAEDEARRLSQETARAYEDLRQTQNSLLLAERLASLGGLVAGIAHEINTPVGITLTSASVLIDATGQLRAAIGSGAATKSDVLSYLDTANESSSLIMTNCVRAAQLIQSFKQIAADQTSEARRRFGLREYIDEVIVSLGPKLKQTAIKTAVDCPEEITVDGYPGAFAQVLMNLTMNALMHAYDRGAPGSITIRARQQQDWITVEYADDGKGIPAENLGRVFEPFFTTKRGQGGTGLGLNIVHNLIVKTFGGSIEVQSEPGRGTRFIIRFPRISPQRGSP